MSTMSQQEANKRLARRVPEEIATERNSDAIDEVFAVDAVEHGSFGRSATGRDEIRARIEGFHDAFPDFEARVEDIVAEGDLVAMRVTLSGRHEGDFMGREPTGKSFEAGNVVFTRIEDGMIAERWIQADVTGIMRQLGFQGDPARSADTG